VIPPTPVPPSAIQTPKKKCKKKKKNHAAAAKSKCKKKKKRAASAAASPWRIVANHWAKSDHPDRVLRRSAGWLYGADR
jgi:hypothetical protein